MIFWFLSSGALLLLLLGLRAALRGRLSPGVQYALWLLALLRLLVPGTFFSSGVSLANLTERSQTARDLEALDGIDLLFYREDAATVEGFPAGRHSGDAAVVLARDATWEAYSRLDRTRHWREIGKALWLAGTALTGAALLGCNLSFGRKLRRSRKPFEVPGSLLPIYVCEGLKTPCLFGLLRPAVYLSPEVAADKTKLRHVLAHEETHYRHGDSLWAALRGVALALHWFNPLAWRAAALCRRDAEAACDAGAVRRLGESERSAYGRTLIVLSVKRAGGYDLLCCATTMSGGKAALRERVAALAGQPKTKVLALAVVLLAALGAGLVLFAGAKPARERPAAMEHVRVMPGETVYAGEILEYSAGGEFRYRLRWTPGSAALTVGVQAVESGAYVSQTRVDGEAEGAFIVPPRSCRAFVRNDGQREVSIALFDYDWAVTGADTELPDRGEPPGPYGDAPKADGLSFPMDFDHNGTQERLLVTSHADGGGTWAALLAENGETIAELHTAHAGWERWFKYISPEGGDYLLRCRPAMGTGIGAYSYELLDASDGERRVVQAGSVEFSVAPDEIMLPAEEMAAFAEELNALLEHSTLLVSTVGGKLVLGPAAGTGYLESYSFMDRELGLTEPLPLREKIARYDALLQTARDG